MIPALPTGCVKYAQTKTFTSATIPKALLKNHSTKPGSWGLIVVHMGCLIYMRTEQELQTLGPDTPGVIFPGELHKVAPKDAVSFHVEFYHDPEIATDKRDNEDISL